MDDPAENPADPAQLHATGDALQRQARFEEAVSYYQHALSIRPQQVQSLNNLAVALKSLGRANEAMDALHQALALRPDSAEIATNLGNLFKETGQIDPAIAHYERSLAHRPAHADTLANLAATLRDAGRIDESIARYQGAIAVQSDHVIAHSGLLYTLHFDPRQTRRTLAEQHHAWNERHALLLTRSADPHSNCADPHRRLRIGYVSPNFSNHPVGRFFLPLLMQHDRSRFEIHCYSDTKTKDAMTQRLRSHADAWHDTASLSDERLAHQIRTDAIDILIDLNLHMSGSGLLAFARKPAPVQITYLAYCSTSGLGAMDYRIGDPLLDPDPLDSSDYAEQTIRLPHSYWCYAAPDHSPAVVELPMLSAGCITFGCLNNFCKISVSTIATWIAILQAVPRSRLLVHAHDGRHRERFREYFKSSDVDPDRIEFVGFLPFDDYLRQYQRIDIALDPFPYAGGTTTCDALWMGVPVVSLVGSTAVSRSGLSILSNAGLADLAVATTDAYVRTAVALASDPEKISHLRTNLRQKLAASQLMDAARFAGDIETIYRSIWTRWCNTQSKT